MKIGLVRRGYSETGGAEAYLRRFAEAAQSDGHECVLFTADWPRNRWDHEWVTVDGPSPRAFADALERSRPRERCDLLFSLERVWRCDVARAGDGVHAAWLERRAAFEPNWKKWLRRFNRKHAEQLELERALFSNDGARAVIANSDMVKREIELHFEYPSARIHVVHNGLPTQEVPANARHEVRAELGLGASTFVLLFVGSGWERKGLRFAVEAFIAAGLSDSILLVAGRGERGLMPPSERVRFLGPRSDVVRLLGASDAFILPTIYDPFSNACLEAFVAGLPVITTRSNGFSEIIAPGLDGHVIDRPDDIPALIEAIRFWSEADLRRNARKRLFERADQYSMDRNLRETIAILQSVQTAAT